MKLKHIIAANVAFVVIGGYYLSVNIGALDVLTEKVDRFLARNKVESNRCSELNQKAIYSKEAVIAGDICSFRTSKINADKSNIKISTIQQISNDNFESTKNNSINDSLPKHGGTFVSGNLPLGDEGDARFLVKFTGEFPVAARDGVGAFRSVCKIAKYAWDDPILYPNKPGVAHLHMFWGNTGVNASSTHETLHESGNSTCRGGAANRTSYWIPALLSSDGHVIQPKEVHSYYKRGYSISKYTELFTIPEGLKMISGDMHSKREQDIRYFHFKCWNKYSGIFSTINGPQCSSDDYLSVNIFFPQCWDGKNLDSPDHKSHMAWPDGGRCPGSHPIPLPQVSAHVLYKFADVESAGKDIHLSSDMYPVKGNGGYSLHADFFEAWDHEVSRTFTQNCLNKNYECHSHLLGDGRIIQ